MLCKERVQPRRTEPAGANGTRRGERNPPGRTETGRGLRRLDGFACCLLVVVELSGRPHIHPDLLGLAFRLLLQLQTQDPGIIISFDALRVYGVGNRERTIEAAVAALHAMEVLFLPLTLEAALAF